MRIHAADFCRVLLICRRHLAGTPRGLPGGIAPGAIDKEQRGNVSRRLSGLARRSLVFSRSAAGQTRLASRQWWRVGQWTQQCWVASLTVGALGCGADPLSESLQAEETWFTVLEHEIGDLHEGDAAFGRVTDVRLGHDGNQVYVLDVGEFRVTVWTPDGALLFAVGRQGEGPAEFRGPGQVHVTPEGFRVRDSGRFVMFSVDGHHLGTVSIPRSVSYRGFRFRPALLLDSTSFVAYPRVPPSYHAGWFGDDPVEELPIVRLVNQDDHWTVDTLVVLDVRDEILAVGRNDDNRELAMFAYQPYRDSDQATYNALSNTMFVARMRGLGAGEVNLTELSAEGDTVWTRTLRFPPIPLTSGDVDVTVEEWAGFLSRARESVSLREARRAIREALYVPEHHPAARSMAIFSNDEFWMRTFEDAGDSLAVWYAVQVGQGDDVPPRRILLPTSFLPRDETASHVWGIQSDSLDMRYVVGRRLVRQARDAG